MRAFVITLAAARSERGGGCSISRRDADAAIPSADVGVEVIALHEALGASRTVIASSAGRAAISEGSLSRDRGRTRRSPHVKAECGRARCLRRELSTQ